MATVVNKKHVKGQPSSEKVEAIHPPQPPLSKGGSETKDEKNFAVIRPIKLTEISPDPFQPRVTFDPVKIAELAESLKQGQLLPAIVYRERVTGQHIIICGERRFRAADLAGLKTLDCKVIPEPTREEIDVMQLTENHQRESLSPVQEAIKCRETLMRNGRTVEWMAEKLGIKASTLTKRLALTTLDTEVQAHVEKGKIHPTVGYLVSTVEDKPEQRSLAAKIISEKLTKADVEALLKARKQAKELPSQTGLTMTPDLEAKPMTKEERDDEVAELTRRYEAIPKPSVPEMKCFVVNYEGAAGPGYYLLAVDLTAAKNYAALQHPLEVKHSVGACVLPAHVSPQVVLTPGHSLTCEWIERLLEAVAQGDTPLDYELRDLVHAVEFLEAPKGVDRQWGRWFEMEVKMHLYGSVPVRCLSRSSDDGVEFRGPMSGTGFYSWQPTPSFKQAFLARPVREVLQEVIEGIHLDSKRTFAKEWKQRKEGSCQHKFGAGHFLPAIEEKVKEPVPKLKPEPKTDEVVDVEPEWVAGWNVNYSKQAFTEGGFEYTACKSMDGPAQAIIAEFNFGQDWDRLATELETACHAARFVANLKRIKHPAGGMAKPWDLVYVNAMGSERGQRTIMEFNLQAEGGVELEGPGKVVHGPFWGAKLGDVEVIIDSPETSPGKETPC
jgi:ParB family chromosome partitioning protein